MTECRLPVVPDSDIRRAMGEKDPQYNEDNRKERTVQLIDDLKSSERLGKTLYDSEMMLDFLSNSDVADVLSLLVTINAGLRGVERKKLVENMNNGGEGSWLLSLHTPASSQDKHDYMVAGIEEIGRYIDSSGEDVDQKKEAVSMAYEALIVWTHMFNDGNGRTSRFMAELIKNGLNDEEHLVSEAVSGVDRITYRHTIATKEYIKWLQSSNDILLEKSDERDPNAYMSDIEAIKLEMQKILQNPDYREELKRDNLERKRRMEAAIARLALKNG